MNEPEQRKIPYVTAVLVAINVVVFLVMEFFGSTESGEYMYAHGASYAPDIFENGQWYRILTSMFMHFGAEHLINNMVMLYILGYQIEENFGRVKYLITYFICGIAGGIISSGIEIITGEYSISAGASGAIFGIFGVLLVMIFKSRKQLGQVSAPRLICYCPYKCSGLFPGLYIANAITTPVTAPPRCAIQSTPSCMLPKTISINNRISRGAEIYASKQ